MLAKSQGRRHRREIPELIPWHQLRAFLWRIAQNTMTQVRVMHTASQPPQMKCPVFPCEGGDTQKISCYPGRISSPHTSITTKPGFWITLPSITWILAKWAADGSPFWPPKAKRSLKACLLRRVQIKCAFSVTVFFGYLYCPPCFSSRAPAWQSNLSPNIGRLQSFAASSFFGFPSCASAWCLVLNGKAQILHFYKVLEQSIWSKAHFSEVSHTLAPTELKNITALSAGLARPGSQAVPWRWLVAARAHCLCHEGYLHSWEAQKN